MVVKVKLRGGLGNQLFQYAYAKKVALEHNAEKIVLDISYYNKSHIRNLELNKYDLPPNVVFSNKSDKLFGFFYYVFRITDKLSLKLRKRHRQESKILSNIGFYLCDKYFTTKPPIKNKKVIYLAGYFQDESEIREIKRQLEGDLVIKEGMSENAKHYLKEMSNKNIIGISIRIGEDYKKFGWPVCEQQYYESALQEVVKLTSCEYVYVFSDNIKKVINEKWFSGYKTTFVQGCNSVEGLELLKNCDHFVIANSTFSWWGAYLGHNKCKKIIEPQYFYGDNKNINSRIHIPGSKCLNNFTGKLS